MLTTDRQLYVAHGQSGPICLCGKMANRHGLITGATGTGKTVTLQVLAETFSEAGVPCFMADMKGDLSGISGAGQMTPFIEKRCAEFGIEAPQFRGSPVCFYDIYGEQGHPMRTTVSNMGPELLSRLLELNEVQAGVLTILFKVADRRGLLLLDLKDLRAMLTYVADHARELSKTYGNVPAASVGAIQRALLALENQGADKFFGEPAFDITDLLACNAEGKGVMSVLAADRLVHAPKLYSTFLLWLLSDLYARLPEVGDQELPRLVFFFDEAHTLFADTPKSLADKIEQVVRLIRSKGVGIYFVTQNPTDIPDAVLAQLGNKVQHALRAFTPKEQKNVKAAAGSFRANPGFKTEDAIMQLGTGEALVSFLDEEGTPNVVERAKILFPLSQIGAIPETRRGQIIKTSPVFGRYDQPIDRPSAFETLLEEAGAENASPGEAEKKEVSGRQKAGSGSKKKSLLSKIASAVAASVAAALGTYVAGTLTGTKSRSKESIGKKITKSAVSTATRTATRELSRSILGNLIKAAAFLLLTACGTGGQPAADAARTDDVAEALTNGSTALDRFQWTREPAAYEIKGDTIAITTAPHTDLWQRTYYHFRNDNAPVLQLQTKEKYFSFVVKTDFSQSHQRFDQCGIVMYLDSENWLKGSVEYENEAFQHLGSVATNNGYSDWATTAIPAGIKTMWYRFSRRADDYCIECSADGISFSQMRVCHMHAAAGAIRFGIYACSPEESSFTAVFTDMKITECAWQAHDGQQPDEE